MSHEDWEETINLFAELLQCARPATMTVAPPSRRRISWDQVPPHLRGAVERTYRVSRYMACVTSSRRLAVLVDQATEPVETTSSSAMDRASGRQAQVPKSEGRCPLPERVFPL